MKTVKEKREENIKELVKLINGSDCSITSSNQDYIGWSKDELEINYRCERVKELARILAQK